MSQRMTAETIDATMTRLIAQTRDSVARILTQRGAQTAQVEAWKANPCDETYEAASQSARAPRAIQEAALE